MKPNHTSATSLGRTPKPVTQQQIAALAHELWLARGCPSGSDLDIWLEAERQLVGGTIVEPMHRDPIPADPDHVTADEDPAVNDVIDREIDEAIPRREPRSPTSF